MIHPSSGLVSYRNLTAPFQALWLQPFRQNDTHCELPSTLSTKAACSHHPAARHRGCLRELLLAFQTPQDGHQQILQSPPLVHPTSTIHTPPRADSQDPFTQLQEHGSLNPARSKEPQPEFFSKEMNQLHRCQMKAMISYIQSPSPAVHSKIWKSWLSLWSLVNQRDAQGQWLHTLRPGSKGNSLSESYWPSSTDVFTDSKLSHPLSFFFFSMEYKHPVHYILLVSPRVYYYKDRSLTGPAWEKRAP